MLARDYMSFNPRCNTFDNVNDFQHSSSTGNVLRLWTWRSSNVALHVAISRHLSRVWYWPSNRRVTQGSRREHRICPGENPMDWAGLFMKGRPWSLYASDHSRVGPYTLILPPSLLDRSARRKSALWLSLLNRSILFSGAKCICNTTTSDSEFDFYLVMTEFVQAKMADPKRGRKHKLLSSWWLQFVSK
jgi:hypothetical protein